MATPQMGAFPHALGPTSGYLHPDGEEPCYRVVGHSRRWRRGCRSASEGCGRCRLPKFRRINVPDLALGLLLIVGLFLGLAVGLYRQTIVLVTAYVATLAASRLYAAVGPTIPLSISPNATVRSAIALAGVFLILVVVLSWLTHYIPNPVGMTGKLTFLSGRAAAGVLGFVWAFLLSAVLVTALVQSFGGSWGVEREQTQLQAKYAIRQSTVVQVLRMYVWPVSQTTPDILPSARSCQDRLSATRESSGAGEVGIRAMPTSPARYPA